MEKTEQVNIRLQAELLQAAKEQAKKEDKPLSQVIRELLKKWLRSK